MSAPTNPTKTRIVTEALYKAGYNSPTGVQVTRAEDYFLEEIKNDIVERVLRDGNTRLKILQTSDIQISVLGQSKYDFPSDFDEEMSIEILDGEHTGTAQAGAAQTITLESGEDLTEDEAKGRYVLLTANTGVEGLRQITAYDTDTLIATVDSAWATNPDATTTYLIVDSFYALKEGNIRDLNDLITRTVRGRPYCFYKIHEGKDIRFIFDRPSDKATYGIRVRYYVNIHDVDLTEGSTLISAFYQNHQSVLTQGVLWKVLEDDDDDKQAAAEAKYEQLVNFLIGREIPYGGEFEGFEL